MSDRIKFTLTLKPKWISAIASGGVDARTINVVSLLACVPSAQSLGGDIEMTTVSIESDDRGVLETAVQKYYSCARQYD